MAGKIGEGHMAAMGRAGLKELSQALVALPESSIRPVEEPGLAGNPTSYEVTAERGGVHGSLKDMVEARAENSGPKQERGLER